MSVEGTTSSSLEGTEVRCSIYARYSSDLQRPTSIEDQIRQCKKHADKHGWTVLPDLVRSDSGISGASLPGRDGLKSLIDQIKRSRVFDCLLIDHTSRFGRNLADVLKLAEIISHYGAFLVFPNQGLDSRHPSFRQMLTFAGMIDEQYLVALRDSVHRGQEGRLLAGYTPGGKCYGYRNVPMEDPSRRGERGRAAILGVKLEITEEEAAVIRRIFEMCASGWGLSRIAKQLNKEGVLSPQPPRKSSPRAWCPSGIRSMLRNEKYIGIVRWNRTKKVRNPETGRKECRRRAASEQTFVEIPALRIIPDELWRRVQARIRVTGERWGKQRVGGFNRTDRSRRYLFSGLLKCGVCGANMVIGGGLPPKYACPMHRNRGACANKLFIRYDRLEEQLMSALTKNLLAPEILDRLLISFDEQLQARLQAIHQSASELPGSEKQLRNELTGLASQQAKIVDAIAAHGISDALSARLRSIETRIREVSKALAVTPGTQEVSVSKKEEIRDFLLRKTQDLMTALGGDAETVRLSLQQHIKKLVLTPKESPNGWVFEVTGDLDLFGGDSGAMLDNSSWRIAQHYTMPPLVIMGVVLDPSLPAAA